MSCSKVVNRSMIMKDAAWKSSSDKSGEGRNFHTVLLLNLPIALVYLIFDLWRVLVSQARVVDQSACDFVCRSTRSYGDIVPIVSSVRAKLAVVNSPIDSELARELLFFNVIIGLCLVPATAFLFICYILRFGLNKSRPIREKGMIRPLLSAIFLLVATTTMNVTSVAAKASVLVHWSGLFVYNVLSLIASFMLLVIVIIISEWIAAARDKRDGSLLEKNG